VIYVVPDGMARSIFENKYSRIKPDGSFQTYAERVTEVVHGNFLLDPRIVPTAYHLNKRDIWQRELERTTELAVAGIFPTSGRHLQHGDDDQPSKLLEMHTNCATAMFSFMLFRLLLRGSGVGRDYSTTCCRVDWANMPDVRLVLDEAHPDFDPDRFGGFLEPLRDAQHKYDSESERVRWFTVADSREGWAKIIEILETASWQEKHRDKLFIFDFTQVRPKGTPIKGLQGRPASGPLPLMDAIAKVASLKSAGMKPWKQALFIDHYLAACVHLGGARRAARMAVKSWHDRDVIEFIDVKRGGFLWSANNSLLVDAEFWKGAREPRHTHARRVFEAAVNAAYWDRTGEPGFINVDMLNLNLEGVETITGASYINPEIYIGLHHRTKDMIGNVLEHVKRLQYPFLTNPCGEVVLSTWGGYCVIGDVCLAKVVTYRDALDAVGLMAKFLIRCNLMRCEYAAEVARTNRIGVSLTGIHEFAWNLFGLTWGDLVDYQIGDEHHPAHAFWLFIDKLRQRVEFDAARFSFELGLVTPHTATTIKPSGTISKVLACTEGAHLPALDYYLRWVQYHRDDPAVVDLTARGYPVEDIGHRYPQQVIIGFPTKQPITDLMGDKVVCASDATPEEQFKWLMLLERFWLGGANRNNQVSYTLKYDTAKVSYSEFMDIILEWQPKVRCCAVMPQSDWRESKKTYGYVPEEPITAARYKELMESITAPVEREAYDDAALACESGVCPIEQDVVR
jgi:adenosylcobalamin-dependent ribonucleoside-triphosphate reductase